MNTCEAFAALLDLYVDGELTADELVRVQTHLDTCPACRAYVDDLLAIRAAFPEVEETVIPDGFADGVMATVRVTPQKKKKTPWSKVLLPLAACLAVVVVLQSGPLAGGGGSAAPRSEGVSAYDTGAPEAAMAADEAVPEEAPAAPEAFTMDGGEAAPESDEYGSVEGAPPTFDDAAKASDRKTDGIPFAELTLTAEEAGEALAAYAPASQEDGTLTYRLTAAEYDALLAALAESGVSVTASALTEAVDGTAFALVTVTP